MTLKRAYATLQTKAAVENGKRIIRGIASTPTPDRMGDIVVPEGAQFQLPLALLWQHNHEQPIGYVTEAKVTKNGISFVAEIASVEEDGDLKRFLDFAWQSIQAQLVRGVSIGFRPLNTEEIPNSWSLKFLEWEWLELSAVTIPANAEATIQAIKSIDNAQRAALGNKSGNVVRLIKSPGASGQPGKTNTKSVNKGNPDMNVKEQIEEFKRRREENLQKMQEIMKKSMDEGRTLDESEQQSYDELEADNEAIEKHLPRLERLQKSMENGATPVGGENSNDAGNSRGRALATVKNTQRLAKGIEFARYAMCLGAAKGDLATAFAIAQRRFPDNERINNVLKAAVAAGTTTDATWASPLVEYNDFAGDFVEYLRPQTIIGRFGTGNIPALRNVPFNIHIKGQTSGGAGYWVGEGKPKPVTKFDFNNVYLGWAKVANIAVLTEELMRFSSPSAEALVRDALASALIERLDTDFVDPAKAASADVSPASITNGVAAIHSSGTDADAVRADLKALWQTFINAKLSPATAVYIMTPSRALALSLMRNSLGQKEFADVNINGGLLEGIPVIVSDYVPTDSNGDLVILVSASDIWLADDGQVVIAASREASIQMLDNPTNASADGTATSMVSMFQTDSVALRAERFINWKKRRASAVAYLDQVNWG